MGRVKDIGEVHLESILVQGALQRLSKMLSVRLGIP